MWDVDVDACKAFHWGLEDERDLGHDVKLTNIVKMSI
jgi:hypothetical protein